MSHISYNVAFVYSLLVIDLLVNITDNVVSPSYLPVGKQNSIKSNLQQDNSTPFTIYIIQIIAIVTVIVDLLWHFLNISDQVRQSAFLTITKRNNRTNKFVESKSPIPHRLALKLVLDKYWWSLLVGLLYLVLTIILQIIRLDPTWHYMNEYNTFDSIQSFNQSQFITSHSKLQYYNEAFERDPSFILTSTTTTTTTPQPSNELQITKSNNFNEKFINKSKLFNDQINSITSSTKIAKNLVPILLLLMHKLVSTCYYISFVVVYRLQPNQMITRIIFQQSSNKLSRNHNAANVNR